MLALCARSVLRTSGRQMARVAPAAASGMKNDPPAPIATKSGGNMDEETEGPPQDLDPTLQPTVDVTADPNSDLEGIRKAISDFIADGQIPSALKFLRETVEVTGRDTNDQAAVLGHLADIEVLSGAPHKAEINLNKAIGLNPEADLKGSLLIRLGDVQGALSKIEKSISSYTVAAETLPVQHRGKALLQRGFAQLEASATPELETSPEKYSESAVESFTAAMGEADLAEEPNSIRDCHYGRAYANCGLNKIPEAMTEFSKVIEIDPSYVPALHARGKYKQMLGDLSGAEEDFSNVLKEADGYFQLETPERAGSIRADTHNLRGLARLHLKKGPEAVEDFTETLKWIHVDEEKLPDSTKEKHMIGVSFFNRAQAHLLAGEEGAAAALKDLNVALDAAPTLMEARNARAFAHHALGNTEEAKADGEAYTAWATVMNAKNRQ